MPTSVSASPFQDWCRSNHAGRVQSNLMHAFLVGRALILTSPHPVWCVTFDEDELYVHVNGGGRFETLDCGAASFRSMNFVCSCLNREAAMTAARRLNGLAAALRRADAVRRFSAYEEAFSLAFCLWSALGFAWQECGEEDGHPSNLEATRRMWDRMFMNMLVSPDAARLVHEAAAAECGLPMPSGGFDSGYGRCNLPYLFDAWSDAEEVELSEGEDASLRLWAYRIYAPFADPAPEGIEFPWHCAAASTHPQDAEPRFEDEDDPSSPVRGRAVRLA